MTKLQKERERQIWWLIKDRLNCLAFHARLMYIDQEATIKGTFLTKQIKR